MSSRLAVNIGMYIRISYVTVRVVDAVGSGVSERTGAQTSHSFFGNGGPVIRFGVFWNLPGRLKFSPGP